MAKVLDFNSLNKPTLDLTMKDDQKTLIRVGMPREELIERLEAAQSELVTIFSKSNPALISELFKLAADLIDCNYSGVRVTAEDLRDKYRLQLDDLVIFFTAYIDFIRELEQAKN